MHEAVRAYLPLVDFLEAALGPRAEIVLHDFSDPNHAVVDIRNGWISGRSVGAPATDLALQIMSKGSNEDRDFIADYVSHNANNTSLRSASFFIRDSEGAIVGMLCINQDVSLVEQLQNLSALCAAAYLPEHMRSSIGSKSVQPHPNPGDQNNDTPETHTSIPVERLSDSTQALITRNIRDQAALLGKKPDDLSQADRIDVIRKLEATGLFRLKGAVASTAAAMGISEPSVYRYLQKIRKA